MRACAEQTLSARLNSPVPRSALAARVRYFASELVFGAQLGFPAAYLALQRSLLAASVAELQSSHRSIIRGNATLGLEGGLYSHPAVESLLFDRACLRASAPCYPGAGAKEGAHPWHWRTTSGLDTLLRQFAQEAESLMRDPDEALTTANEHFSFLWEVGAADVHDGLTRLTRVFHDDVADQFLLVKALLITPLPVMLLVMFLFFRRLFFPWLSRARKESSRVAELLSQLPRELNVETLLIEAMDQGEKKEDDESTLDGGKPAAAG